MKTTIKILFLLLIVTGCKPHSEVATFRIDKKSDSCFVRAKDTLYDPAYPNFTKSRHVTFMIKRDYKTGLYWVRWFLWIDNDIVESDVCGLDINGNNIGKYMDKICRQENDHIPEIIKDLGIK